MVNILGEEFDIWRLGEVELLRIPQNSTESTAMVRMIAEVSDVGNSSVSSCAEAPYMTHMRFHGSWFGKQEILINVAAGEINISVGDKSMEPRAQPVKIGEDISVHHWDSQVVKVNIRNASIAVQRDHRPVHFFLNMAAHNLD